MASPPLWLGKLNSLTDTFDVEIISDLDQRIPSSFGNKSWAIMTYLRAGPVSVRSSKSKCVIVRVTVTGARTLLPEKIDTPGAMGKYRTLFHRSCDWNVCTCKTASTELEEFNKAVSPHMFIKNCKLDLGITDNFCGWFQLHHTSGKAGPRGWKTIPLWIKWECWCQQFYSDNSGNADPLAENASIESGTPRYFQADNL